jgi:hypothetical protein
MSPVRIDACRCLSIAQITPAQRTALGEHIGRIGALGAPESQYLILAALVVDRLSPCIVDRRQDVFERTSVTFQEPVVLAVTGQSQSRLLVRFA